MGDRPGGVWGELRRRRVFSAAAAYAAVSFVLLQLAEILFPAFGLGAGAMRALFAGLFGLAPIVLAISWVYDVTRHGFERTDGDDGGTPSLALVGSVVIASLVVGGVTWWGVRTVEVPETATASAASIAVLPFLDRSPNGDQRYLGDGLAEEILNILAGVDGLQVAARTSSFAFRDSNASARDIGAELGVATLLEGSVARDADRVRVTAQLIATSTGFHLWSENFEHDVANLFELQDSIAARIVRELLGRLDLPGTRVTRHVAPPEAQDLYWRGREYLNRRGPMGIPTAIGFFQDALAEDSLFSEAYAGLAAAQALLPQYVRNTDSETALETAAGLARRALEIDPNLAEAHASLGLVQALRQNRPAALASLDRAIQLNPSYAPALQWRGNVLADMGRLAEAERDAGRAAELDPFSHAIAADHGNILLWSGDLEGARREYDRALSIEFGFGPAVFGSALVALLADEAVPLQMALTQWGIALNVPPTVAADLSGSMMAFRQLGTPSMLPPVLTSMAESGMVGSGTMAALSALVGERQSLYAWLDRAVEDGTWVGQYLTVSPVYDPYRSDPEFLDIQQRIAAPVETNSGAG
jgi:TolB-like protein/Tfp pilus assembly protein PilF